MKIEQRLVLDEFDKVVLKLLIIIISGGCLSHQRWSILCWPQIGLFNIVAGRTLIREDWSNICSRLPLVFIRLLPFETNGLNSWELFLSFLE